MNKKALYIGAFVVTVAMSFVAGRYYGAEEVPASPAEPTPGDDTELPEL